MIMIAEEENIRVERFNNANFEFWKIQIENYMYQKDLYLPLGEKALKPKEMTDGDWGVLYQKALGVICLSLALTVALKVSRKKTT